MENEEAQERRTYNFPQEGRMESLGTSQTVKGLTCQTKGNPSVGQGGTVKLFILMATWLPSGFRPSPKQLEIGHPSVYWNLVGVGV